MGVCLLFVVKVELRNLCDVNGWKCRLICVVFWWWGISCGFILVFVKCYVNRELMVSIFSICYVGLFMKGVV